MSSITRLTRGIPAIPAEGAAEAQVTDQLDDMSNQLTDQLAESLASANNSVREAAQSYESPLPAPRLREPAPRRQEIARELTDQNPIQRRIETLMRDSSRAITRVAKIKSDGASRRAELETTIEELTRQLSLLEEERREHELDLNQRIEHQLLLKQVNDEAIASLRSGLKKPRED